MMALASAHTDQGFLIGGLLCGIGHGYCFPVLTSQVVTRAPDNMRGTALALFTGLSLLIIAIVLSVVFRKLTAVLVPLIVTVVSLTATVGMMGTLGISFMPVSETVPSFLLSVGVGGSVHLLVIFLQRRRAGADPAAAWSVTAACGRLSPKSLFPSGSDRRACPPSSAG